MASGIGMAVLLLLGSRSLAGTAPATGTCVDVCATGASECSSPLGDSDRIDLLQTRQRVREQRGPESGGGSRSSSRTEGEKSDVQKTTQERGPAAPDTAEEPPDLEEEDSAGETGGASGSQGPVEPGSPEEQNPSATQLFERAAPEVSRQDVPHKIPEAFKDPREAFQFFDTDRDGTLTKQEFSKAFLEASEAGSILGEESYVPFSSAELDTMMSTLDADKSDDLSWDEFRSSWLKNREEVVSKQGPDAVRLKEAVEARPAPSPAPSPTPPSPTPPSPTPEEALLEEGDSHSQKTGWFSWWQYNRRRRRTIQPRPASAGSVEGLYTFGAPGTATTPLKNRMRGDGCFPGLRVYTQSRWGWWWWGFYYMSDPVAWLATHGGHSAITGFRHAMMNALTLDDWNLGNPNLIDCSDHGTWLPNRDWYYWIPGHKTDHYAWTLQAQQRYPQPTKMIDFASGSYVATEALYEVASQRGRRLVGRAVEGDDSSALFQDPSNFDCVVTFRGTDGWSDWVNNLDADTVDFCGFSGVHKGFVNEFKQIVSTDNFRRNVRDKLPNCAKVHASGHSLGGALAELFTACANKAPVAPSPGAADYALISWTKSAAQAMEELPRR